MVSDNFRYFVRYILMRNKVTSTPTISVWLHALIWPTEFPSEFSCGGRGLHVKIFHLLQVTLGAGIAQSV
jgi:hypothetical protein